jgi:peptidoglycan glycosyltransferase
MTGSYYPDKYPRQPGWKAYQEYLQRNQRRTGRPRPQRRARCLAAALLILAAAVIWVFYPSGSDDEARGSIAVSPPARVIKQATLLKKADVHILLGKTSLSNLQVPAVRVIFDGRPYQVDTSLDVGLQQYLLRHMDRVNSRYIGIVAMEPDTGRIIAMAGFNKIDPHQDPCLTADYPAASLFKIITAAAAIQEHGYTAGSRFKFNGYAHTLYKRQLTKKTNRYTTYVSLRDSFARSINPVFGKIGAFYLDRQALITFADAFAFNQAVDFELPWPTSKFSVKDELYNRAEIASGFNHRTRISPLHGAFIVATVVHNGVPVEPTLVDQIVNDAGKVVYRSKPRFLPAAVSPKTAHVLDQLMIATISSGTARRMFRGYRRNKVLSRLELGGKTGTIYNRAHDARFDWFIGFAAEKNGGTKLVVAVMVAHGEYIGTRSGRYARMAMEYYFKDYFTRKEKAGKDSSG